MYICANCGTGFDGNVCPNCCTIKPRAAVLRKGGILADIDNVGDNPAKKAASFAEELSRSRELDARRKAEEQRQAEIKSRAEELVQKAQRQLEELERRRMEAAEKKQNDRIISALPNGADPQKFAAQAKKAANWTRKAPLARKSEAGQDDKQSIPALKLRIAVKDVDAAPDKAAASPAVDEASSARDKQSEAAAIDSPAKTAVYSAAHPLPPAAKPEGAPSAAAAEKSAGFELPKPPIGKPAPTAERRLPDENKAPPSDAASLPAVPRFPPSVRTADIPRAPGLPDMQSAEIARNRGDEAAPVQCADSPAAPETPPKAVPPSEPAAESNPKAGISADQPMPSQQPDAAVGQPAPSPWPDAAADPPAREGASSAKAPSLSGKPGSASLLADILAGVWALVKLPFSGAARNTELLSALDSCNIIVATTFSAAAFFAAPLLAFCVARSTGGGYLRSLFGSVVVMSVFVTLCAAALCLYKLFVGEKLCAGRLFRIVFYAAASVFAAGVPAVPISLVAAPVAFAFIAVGFALCMYVIYLELCRSARSGGKNPNAAFLSAAIVIVSALFLLAGALFQNRLS